MARMLNAVREDDVTNKVAGALLVVALLGCESAVDREGGTDASAPPTPTVSFEVRGSVTDEVPEGEPGRFLMEVREAGPFDLGDDAVVVFDASMLRCASGADVHASPAPGDEVWLQDVRGISESEPPILHPEAVVLDC